jgi:hypothetical protein
MSGWPPFCPVAFSYKCLVSVLNGALITTPRHIIRLCSPDIEVPANIGLFHNRKFRKITTETYLIQKPAHQFCHRLTSRHWSPHECLSHYCMHQLQFSPVLLCDMAEIHCTRAPLICHSSQHLNTETCFVRV